MTNELDPRARGHDQIARLIAEAGPRPAPAAQLEQQVRAAVEEAWQQAAARRRLRRGARWMAAAASLTVLTAGLLWVGLYRHAVPAAAADATLLAVRGDVTVQARHEQRLIAAGSRLPAGTTVQSASNGFVLMTVAADSLRLGPNSRLRIGAGGEVRLAAGRMYVETSEPARGAPPLVVKTPFGRVSHLGTQFQVRVRATAMAVSVRSGHVRVKDASGQVQHLAAGQEVQVLAGGQVQRRAVSPYGPQWAWADALVPDLPIDGRPLSAFLDWYAHEMGLHLVLVGQGTAAALRHTRLSGSIAGLTPNQALVAVMATTRFEYDTKVPGELRISMPGPTSRGS